MRCSGCWQKAAAQTAFFSFILILNLVQHAVDVEELVNLRDIFARFISADHF
jgi:hypothetical protein